MRSDFNTLWFQRILALHMYRQRLVGATEHQLKSVMGWKRLNMVGVYIEKPNRGKVAGPYGKGKHRSQPYFGKSKGKGY